MATTRNLAPHEVMQLLTDDAIVLIDVREADEHARERIQGAVLCPLSTFHPSKLPDPCGKSVVFHCAGGVRSAQVIAKCCSSGLAYDTHMEGGIKAWKAAGLPIIKS